MHGPYPGELRMRVIRFVEGGGSRRDAADQRSVSVLRSSGCTCVPVEEPPGSEADICAVERLVSRRTRGGGILRCKC
jgi:hypothetical protein